MPRKEIKWLRSYDSIHIAEGYDSQNHIHIAEGYDSQNHIEINSEMPSYSETSLVIGLEHATGLNKKSWQGS